VRKELVEFSASKIAQHARSDEGAGGTDIVYCSLGCGCLYFDWELLDRLVRVERVGISKVLLMDRVYRPSSNESLRATRALDAFVAWFAHVGFETHVFAGARALRRWASAFDARAHVMMQCDAVDTFPILDANNDFCEAVMRDGALNLQMYSQLLRRRRPGAGRRRDPVPVEPARKVRRWRADEASFEHLEEQKWRNGAWIDESLAALQDGLWQDMDVDSVREELEREYR